MNTYITVTITKFSTCPDLNVGFIYTSVNSCHLEMSNKVSYDDGKNQLVKIAVKYNLPIIREPNPYDSTIVTYRVSGFLD